MWVVVGTMGLGITQVFLYEWWLQRVIEHSCMFLNTKEYFGESDESKQLCVPPYISKLAIWPAYNLSLRPLV